MSEQSDLLGSLQIISYQVMSQSSAYSRKEWVRAVNISAVLGWSCVALPFVSEMGVSILPLAAIFGLPVAFIVCWVIVAPILKRLMRHAISWTSAAIWGAVASTIIASVFIAINRFRGWRQSLDPNSYSQLGGGEFIKSVDGILTPYGLQSLAQNTVIFVLLGVGIALVIRMFMGPGRS